jgi:hypothetical protein
MSLIVDINPVPWEILDLVRSRIVKNRANRQKRQPEKPSELRRVMQVDNGILAKQRWEEPSFIGDDSIARIVVLFTWAGAAPVLMERELQRGPQVVIRELFYLFTTPATTIQFITESIDSFTRFTGGLNSSEANNGFSAITFIVDKTKEDPAETLSIYQQRPNIVSIKILLQADYSSDLRKITTISVYAFDENEFLLRLTPNKEGLLDQGIKYANAFTSLFAPVIKLNNPGASLIYQGLPGETGILEIPLDGSSAVLT